MVNTTIRAQNHHRVIIIGAGPGGLQLAYDLTGASIDYLLLERGQAAGSFFERLPVHRKLLSINKPNTGFSNPEKNLRWDWNSLISDDAELRFSNYDQPFFPHADALVRYYRDFCSKTKLRAQFSSNVKQVEKLQHGFALITTEDKRLTCDVLVVATGLFTPYVAPIQGIELAETYGSYDRRPEAHRNRDILIIGKGNSAFEVADEFLPNAAHIHLISPEPLHLAFQSHYVGHLRLINSPFLETFLLKQENAVLNGSIHRIARVGDKLEADITFLEDGRNVTFNYDRVITCTGFSFDTSIFGGGLEPALLYDGRIPSLTCHWESENIPGLFFCGTLMQANDYQKAASSFLHGIRYNARTLSRLLECRLGTRPYPHQTLPPDPTVLLNHIFERISVVSSLWHLHGSLCDAYLFSHDAHHFIELQDVPVRMMAEDPSFSNMSRLEFRLTFENPEDPKERGKFSPGGLLHPALYLFVCGSLVAERHMYEDVYAEWERKDFGFCFEDVLAEYVDAIASNPNGHFKFAAPWPGQRSQSKAALTH